MNENAFWQLIGDCTPSMPDPDAEQPAAALTNRLAAGPLATGIGFAEQLSWALHRLDRKEYGHDLSSDSFLYARTAVVAAGRETYEAVLPVRIRDGTPARSSRPASGSMTSHAVRST